MVPPLAITPGTSFMQDVQGSLQYYICQRLISYKFQHLQMELSGSTVKVRKHCMPDLLICGASWADDSVFKVIPCAQVHLTIMTLN